MPEQGRDGTTQRLSRKVQRYSVNLQQRCMRILELRRARYRSRNTPPPPTPAIDLAMMLKHWPDASRETLRRNVRGLIKYMRDHDAPIASGPAGYWAAETVQDFERAASFLRGIGLGPLATNARLQQVAAHDRAQGQTRFPAYHALLTGRACLDHYIKRSSNLHPTLATPLKGADAPDAAPNTAEQSDQQWSDSLFASA
ncbi:MAG: hypothetical protein AAF711_00455 [Planctomycetota bacterium]